MTGLMTSSITASRRSLCETLSLCCVEITTVSTRTGLAVHVFHGNLGLAVRTEEIDFARLADLRELVRQLVRELDRHGHQLGRLVARVAEHHALVAGAAGVHAHGDVGRLRLDGGEHAAGFGVEAILRAGVANVVDHFAGDALVFEDAACFFLVVISPAITTRPVVTSVSQATRPIGSCVSTVSSTASEIGSAILSG